MFSEHIEFIRSLYPNRDFIALHEPVFAGHEKKYVTEAIDSTFVSSVGEFVNKFEKDFSSYIGAPYGIVTSNGTSAIHAALHLLGVQPGDEVITQALTFVATANAISYCYATPVFVDSDIKTLGMSASSLKNFFETHTEVIDSQCINKKTGRRISACVPMHVFGHPVAIEEIVAICDKFQVPVLEDAAESVGSLYKGVHTGLFGKIGVFSFNGNKIITAGGGGLIATRDPILAKRAKHITTTSKVPHAWQFFHDEIGFNYRMPNLNAALISAQLEKLPDFVENKRQTANQYRDYFQARGVHFFTEPEGARSNYWLNAIFLENRTERDLFLQETNAKGVMTRPVWELMTDLPMFKNCQSTELTHARWISERLVNIPSSVRKV